MIQKRLSAYPLSKGVHKSEIVPPLFVSALAAKTPIRVKGSQYTFLAGVILPDHPIVV